MVVWCQNPLTQANDEVAKGAENQRGNRLTSLNPQFNAVGFAPQCFTRRFRISSVRTKGRSCKGAAFFSFGCGWCSRETDKCPVASCARTKMDRGGHDPTAVDRRAATPTWRGALHEHSTGIAQPV